MGYDGWPDAPAADEATSWEFGENTRAVHLPAPAAVTHQPSVTASCDHPAAEAFATAVAAMEGSHLAQPTMAQAALAAAGIEPAAVRFSIGLEDGEDIIADAHLPLDSLGRVPATSAPG